MARKVIPFGRPLKPGARGRDVIAVKRALARAGRSRLTGLTPVLGPLAVQRLKRFQKRHGIPPTGNYGPHTHRRLAAHFDPYAVFLYTGAKPVRRETLSERQRRLIVAAALALYAVRDKVHYTQTLARMSIVRRRLRPPFAEPSIEEDCSSSVTGLYWIADAEDPNGRGYDGTGYTGTLARNGRPVTLLDAKPGDLVFYGRAWPWGHVALYLGAGKVWSHGSEGGPYLLPINYRSDLGQIRSYL